MICVQKLTFFNSVCTLLCNSLKSPNTVNGTIKTILFSLTAAVIVILWRWEVWRREGWIRVKLQDFPAPVSTSVSDFPRMDGGAITWKFWQKKSRLPSPTTPPHWSHYRLHGEPGISGVEGEVSSAEVSLFVHLISYVLCIGVQVTSTLFDWLMN